MTKPIAVPVHINDASYKKLLSKIRRRIQQGMTRIQHYVDYEKVWINWDVGAYIDTFLGGGDHRAGYGRKMVIQLAGDLEEDRRYLYQAVQFYKAYPVLPKPGSLCWSHYRLLMTIPDKKARSAMERRVIKENLSVPQFEEIFRMTFGQKEIPLMAAPRQVACARGMLYTYRIIKVNYVHGGNSDLMVDLGFDMRIERTPEAEDKFTSGVLVESVKTEGGYQLKTSKVPRESLYTYRAYIERVVDGDTVVVNIDCGFGIWVCQKLRLKGIDAPELPDPAGVRARDYVEDVLAKVPFIILKTEKSNDRDKYGRFLADIFFDPNQPDARLVAQHGRFLNQELLDKGFAVAWKK